jgi:hypothetical protein
VPNTPTRPHRALGSPALGIGVFDQQARVGFGKLNNQGVGYQEIGVVLECGI